MKIIKSDEIEWEDGEGYSKKILFDKIKKDKVVVQYVKIKPGEVAKSHYHKKQTEVFYFLNANGYWIVNGIKTKIKKKEFLVIEPEDIHEVVNNTKEDYLYIAFKYNYESSDIYWD